MTKEEPVQGALRRSAVTGLAAARIGARQLRRKITAPADSAEEETRRQLQHEETIGRILFAAMNQLRGTALKASQWLSMEAGFLPDGVRHQLAHAHYQVTPLNRALVGKVFRSSLGDEPEHLFDHFESKAFAAASLGQVHRAILAPHEALAVKVQYPGIDTTIGSDMRLLRRVLSTLGRGALQLPDSRVVDQLLDELEALLLGEVDYLREAATMQWFAHNASQEGLVYPTALMTHTSKQILTQTLLPGQHLEEWLANAPSQALRDLAGQRLFDWLLHCAFDLGRIQADCHPGNFLFMADGRVGVIDLGCTRELSMPFRHHLRQAWSHTAQGTDLKQPEAVLQTYVALGMLDKAMTLDTFVHEVVPAARPMQEWMLTPLRHEVYDFAQLPPAPVPSQQQQKALAKHMAGMPGELPSFDRAWIGTLHILRRLGARVKIARLGVY